MKIKTRYLVMIVLAAFYFISFAGPVFCGGPVCYLGWEKGGEYDKNYKVSEYDSFKGVIVKITKIRPLKSMAPGVGLKVRDREGEMIDVHLGPIGFLEPGSIGLRKGDKVKVKGVWAEIADKEFFMASKVKRSEYDELKVRRTKDGFPFWAMTAAELKKEREQ